MRRFLAELWWEVGIRLFPAGPPMDPEPEPEGVVVVMVVLPSDSEPARCYVAAVAESNLIEPQ